MERPTTWGTSAGAHHALGRIAGEVDGADVQALGAQLVEPEQRQLGEQRALARNRLAHDHVKGADAVGGHHQDAVVAHGVVVAHLATREQRQGSQGGGVQSSGGHDRSSVAKEAGKKKARLTNSQRALNHSGRLSQVESAPGSDAR